MASVQTISPVLVVADLGPGLDRAAAASSHKPNTTENFQ